MKEKVIIEIELEAVSKCGRRDGGKKENMMEGNYLDKTELK